MEERSSLGHIFLVFLKLGCTSFGGPVAHIGFFRNEFVVKRQWLDDKVFSDYLSLCQFIPGPASSQLGMAVGYHHSRYLGAVVAWFGFTLPSAALLTGFALLLLSSPEWLSSGTIQGLKLVALAVVLQAFLGMRSTLAPDNVRITIMVLSTAVFLFWQSVVAAPVVLLCIGLGFALFGRSLAPEPKSGAKTRSNESATANLKNTKAIGRAQSYIPLVVFALFLLLLLIPFSLNFTGLIGETAASTIALEQVSAFYRAGALVFGGGHVVLPLLEAEIVETGWVSKDIFLAGYGLAQAVPGPLFTFSAFLGASSSTGLNGLTGALAATIAIFLPSFLLLFSVLPYWERIRASQKMQSALWAVNAAVLGFLLATIYDPVVMTSVSEVKHVVFAAFAYLTLATWKAPVVMVVFSGALGGCFLL